MGSLQVRKTWRNQQLPMGRPFVIVQLCNPITMHVICSVIFNGSCGENGLDSSVRWEDLCNFQPGQLPLTSITTSQPPSTLDAHAHLSSKCTTPTLVGNNPMYYVNTCLICFCWSCMQTRMKVSSSTKTLGILLLCLCFLEVIMEIRLSQVED